jgi:hypothetical protein
MELKEGFMRKWFVIVLKILIIFVILVSSNLPRMVWGQSIDLSWNTFMGSSGNDACRAVAVDGSGNMIVVGESAATWGSPVNGHAGGNEAFAAKLYALDPEPDIKANGSDAAITISKGDPLSITVELFARTAAGDDGDWWLVVRTPFPAPNDWFYFDMPSRSWMPGRSPTRQGTVFNIYPPRTVPNTSGFALGTYTFYFGVDMVMNGVINLSEAFYDSVRVIINL